jgi:hypothetical protein
MRRRVVAIALTVGVLAFIVSPAGAATTAWTAGKLTKAVKALVRADKKDNRRDRRQRIAISKLRAQLAAMGIDVSELQDSQLYQRALDAGIIESVGTFSDSDSGCTHGGYALTLVSGKEYYVCHGEDGEPGARGPAGPQGEQGERGLEGAPGQNGAPGANGAPGLSAYQLWLADGNEGSVGDFMRSLHGANGLSAYELWLEAGGQGSLGQFLASLKGAKGDQGDQGARGQQGDRGPQGEQGPPGIANATLDWVCVKQSGSNSNSNAAIARGSECPPGSARFQVYFPNS